MFRGQQYITQKQCRTKQHQCGHTAHAAHEPRPLTRPRNCCTLTPHSNAPRALLRRCAVPVHSSSLSRSLLSGGHRVCRSFLFHSLFCHELPYSELPRNAAGPTFHSFPTPIARRPRALQIPSLPVPRCHIECCSSFLAPSTLFPQSLRTPPSLLVHHHGALQMVHHVVADAAQPHKRHQHALEAAHAAAAHHG
jgi:hypothetical protein